MYMINVTLYLAILFAFLAITLRSILFSVLSLATTSILLSIAFFQLNCPVAGAIELSVGAGLITVLIVLTMSFTQSEKEKKYPYPITWIFVSAILALLFFFASQFLAKKTLALNIPPSNWRLVGETFWKTRNFDLLPLSLLIISVVMGILALLRPGKTK